MQRAGIDDDADVIHLGALLPEASTEESDGPGHHPGSLGQEYVTRLEPDLAIGEIRHCYLPTGVITALANSQSSLAGAMARGGQTGRRFSDGVAFKSGDPTPGMPVSYTHLTLPTILR